MLQTKHFITTDETEVRRLVRDNPWGTFVANTAQGIVASHYPVLLDEEDTEGISIVSHVGKPDDRNLELGEREMMLIVQGPHGYISPGWYDPDDIIPTWNHVTAHLYGVPELLSPAENYEVLTRLVDTFEAPMPEPQSISTQEEFTRGVAQGTVGLRMRITRFEARLKLSQNKSTEVRSSIVNGLRASGPYSQPALADEMARVPALSEENL